MYLDLLEADVNTGGYHVLQEPGIGVCERRGNSIMIIMVWP